jgi:hypothetical protein
MARCPYPLLRHLRQYRVTLLVIGGAVWLLIQFTGLRIWHAVLVLIAGFYLALSAVLSGRAPVPVPGPGTVRPLSRRRRKETQ